MHGEESGVVPDTISLGDVVVKASGPTAPGRKKDGSMRIDASMYRSVPRMFGEKDMLRLLTTLPGINASSDYSSGANVDGSDYSQHMYRINGVPVLFPYHFGGIFSTLNSYIYPHASLQKSIHAIDAPSVGGAVVDLRSDTVRIRPQVEANVGMLASSVGIKTPLGNKVTLMAGGRISYISSAYGWLLRGDDTELKHDFGDLDMTVGWRISPVDRVDVTVHYNKDFLKYDDSNYDMVTRFDWHNVSAGINWHRKFKHSIMNVFGGYAGTGTDLQLDLGEAGVVVPTSSKIVWLENDFHGLRVKNVDMRAGCGVYGYFERPQWASVDGFGQTGGLRPSMRKSVDSKIWVEGNVELARNLKMRVGVDASWFASGRYNHADMSPRMSLLGNIGNVDWVLHAGRYRQSVHYVGLSEIGLASNFRYSATEKAPVQQGWHFAASGGWRIAGGMLELWGDLYYKLISHQAEYVGSVLDLMDSGFDVSSCVTSARGRSYGASVMLRYPQGPVSGWVSYGYGNARRQFYGSREWFTASGSVAHTLKANCAWQINDKFSVGGMFTLSSGRPYTPVKAIYIIGERLMMEYGKRNSARMPLYHRLDIGGSFMFETKGRYPLEHLISVSVLNVYGHKNVEIQSWGFSLASREYYLRRVGSLYRFLPSLSYTVKFAQ
jgi:hypothetical protein